MVGCGSGVAAGTAPMQGSTAPLDAWLDMIESTISLGVRPDGLPTQRRRQELRQGRGQLETHRPGPARAARRSGGSSRPKASRSCRPSVRDDCRWTGRRSVARSGRQTAAGPISAAMAKWRRSLLRQREGVAAEEGQAEATAAWQESPAVAREEAGRRPASTRSSRSSPSTTRTQEHRLVCGTRGDASSLGRPMRREAARIPMDKADEKERQRRRLTVDPAIRSNGKACRWMCWGWTSTTRARTCTRPCRSIYGDDDEAGKQWAGQLLDDSSSTRVTRRPGSNSGSWRVVLKRGGPSADRLVSDAGRGARGDDPRLPRSNPGVLADRQRADGGDVQDADGSAEGFGDAVGQRQRRGDH